MKVYAVRFDANTEEIARELVGVFVCDDIETLAELVDAACPVLGCEYAVLRGMGGIYWSGRAPTVPFVFGEDENSFEKQEHCGDWEMMGSWENLIYKAGADRLEWFPLKPPPYAVKLAETGR